jgi:GWxTD domain-containing protein
MIVSQILFLLLGTHQEAARRLEPQPALQAVYSSLDSGQVQTAITLAERYAAANPRSAEAFLAVGDAYAARPVAGRFLALKAYRQASVLAPTNPEPRYQMVLLAFKLGGADGERIAREELERILKMNPFYEDAWNRWLLLYRNAGGRRRVIQSLRAHDSSSTIKAHIAQLLIEDEAYDQANHLLDTAFAADAEDPRFLALRAQSAFESGDTAAGVRYYQSALAHAERDTTGALWEQIAGIASPAELRAWPAVPPRTRAAWIQSFWARRNPDLFSGTNQRIAEHFARLRYARKRYPLFHPLALYHRSTRGRALNLEPSDGERVFHQRCELTEIQAPYEGGAIPAAPVTSVRERQRVSLGILSFLTPDEQARALQEHPGLKATFAPTIYTPLGMDLREVDSMAARVGYNLTTGLDDRGLMYLRFGAPHRVMLGGNNPADPQCRSDELERWRYDTFGEVRFARPSAFSQGERTIGEMVFRPMNEAQFTGMSLALTRDASSAPAPLVFGVWTTQFRALAEPAMTELVVVSSKGGIAVSLVPNAGPPTTSQAPDGIARISAAPGNKVLLTHAKVADTLGRQTLRVNLRSFGSGPALSDLLVTPAWGDEQTLPNRTEMVANIDRDLTFRAGATWRVYAEVYNLARDSSYNYQATYQLLQSRDLARDLTRDTWPDAVTIEFQRTGVRKPGEDVRETLLLTPDLLPPGRYILRLIIRDNITQERVGQSIAVFEIQ